ncbi:methylated-DNA--[protein]-cysteine S-methyltransferase [Maribellus sp. YY47]|uniref:methylated-DNA--[protein]-cysteine S-methyltransferase n=1 Tax=Maribellus sp. YY47 TaxID=2929486 RepID=UPI002000CBD7|nr:methylated-DNA--[protein]-cysteine S-methyltransferase [Maribellus sp. YY47]MCK3683007.1 methylated-DNA--[protein]-cysteine S-methyltransferase [Maribellus sp. YY47]
MPETFDQYIFSPVGWLKISTTQKALVSISFVEEEGKSSTSQPAVMEEVILQLNEYFDGTRLVFDIPLDPEGTDFQKKVWQLVSIVPFGETVSYLDIAILSGSEKNTRAVGLANGKNPIPVIIPCHRIIGSNGKLTGYAGGLDKKRWLLQHELRYGGKNSLLF